jgi:monoamine oxidase
LNSPLRRVRQGPDGVELIFEHGKEKVDAVILTLPPPALERVVFEPALSTAKRCAIEASEMGRVVKICWQFREAWWRGDEWSGSMQCDGPIQQTWDGSMGTAPILSAYVCGDDSVIWQNERNPVLAGLREVTRYWPEAQELYVRGWMHDWTRDPYAMGGFAHLAPGYVLEHMKHIAPPDGRIHFAGEHTASWVGFIEGALESAERVVGEIVN